MSKERSEPEIELSPKWRKAAELFAWQPHLTAKAVAKLAGMSQAALSVARRHPRFRTALTAELAEVHRTTGHMRIPVLALAVRTWASIAANEMALDSARIAAAERLAQWAGTVPVVEEKQADPIDYAALARQPEVEAEYRAAQAALAAADAKLPRLAKH
jgi:hypothetical protein